MDRKALFITLMAIGVLHPYAFSNEQIEKEPTEDVLNQRIDSVYRTVYYEDFEQAAVVLRQVKHEAEDATLWHVQLSALLNLHYCAQHHGVVEDMVLYLDEARDVYRNRESEMPVDWCKKLRQKVRYAEANAAYNFGEYERAVQHFKMILESGDTLEPVFHYKCLSYVGHAYASMDNYDLAIAHHDQALAYLPPGEKYDYYRGVSFSYLGIAYKRLHDLKLDEAALRKARSSCLTSLSYFLKSSNKNTRGPIGCYSLLSEIYGLLGQPDSSAYYLTQGQLLDPESIEIHRVWGMHYGRLGQYEKARQHVRKSSAIIRESRGDRHFLIGRNLVQVGNHYKEEARWEQAVQHYQRAFRYLGAEDSLTENVYAHPHLADVISPKDFFECLIAKAFALKEWSGTPHTPDALLRLKKSIETYELAVQFIDQQRSKFESPAYKQLMAAKALSVYEQAIDACYLAIDKGLDSLSYTQLAFYFMEKNKNRQLREALRVSQSNRYAGVPNSLLKREANLGQKLRYYNRLLTRQKMSSNQKSPKTLRMEQEVFALNNQWERLNGDLITNYPDYYRLKYGEPIMDLKTVQTKLGEGTLLLAYFYGDQDVFLFGVTRETVTFEKLRFSTEMANGLSQMLQQIKHPSTGRPPVELMRHLHALHQFLLPESQETLEGVDELIVVPDGILGYLPFEILVTTLPENNIEQAKFLIEDVAITYAYSSYLVGEEKISGKPELEYLGFAPSYQTSTASTTRSGKNGEASLGALKYNQEEVINAQTYFSGEAYLDSASTEARFNEKGAEAGILHFSMHALINEEHPELSRLMFYQPTSRTDSTELDGSLHLYELYQNRLQAQLAVLSACNTGDGQLKRGEGISSLGRAFRYAGCNSIVMSLWEANDKHTQFLMNRFFKHLKRGIDKDEALRQAKLDFLREPTHKYFKHPFYWASFILIGEPSSLYFGTPDWLVMALAVLVFASLFMLWFYRKRARPEKKVASSFNEVN